MTTTTCGGRKPASVIFRSVNEDELVFYTYFVQRHGGALVPLEPGGNDYRMNFPRGTRKLPNEEENLSLRKSYVLLYPDGTRVLWYRRYVLEGKECQRVMFFPFDEETLRPPEPVNAP
jgi:hypothetical protein